jgi:hypothetical protein
MKKLILALLIFTVYGTADAQRYGEIGLFGGGSYYLGDLNPGNQFLLTKPAFGAFLRHNFNERVALRGGFTYGTLQGDDYQSKVNPERGLNFTSHVSDISATLELNFFDYFIGSLRHFVTPYMFAGASVFMYNPKATYNGDTRELHGLKTEGQGSIDFPDRKMYKRTQFAIPFGIGIKYSLNSFMGISASWTMNKTFTDYIDDVSTTYVEFDPNDNPLAPLFSDPTSQHEKDMQRGDPTYNDWYSFVGLSLSIRLNYLEKERCLNIFY